MPAKKIPKGANKKEKQNVISENIAMEMRKHPERSREQNIAIGISESNSKKKPTKKKK
jgi:hypothetical protein